MSKSHLQNKELDRIGQTLFDAARLKSADIDQIVSSPHLFNSVKAKIEAERCRTESKKSFNFSAFFRYQPRWIISAAVILFVCIGGAIGWSRFGKVNYFAETAHNSTPEIQFTNQTTEISQSDFPLIADKLPKAKKTDYSPTTSAKTNRAKPATVKVSNVPTEKPRKEQPRQKFNREIKETAGEFYAVGFTGNAVEASEEMHIVRAELTRSSLFALGVNLSLENETEKIKTDLLVGADGVARAIRFVN